MSTLRTVLHFMRADFLERTRSYRFMVTLLFIVFFTYFFVPSLDAPLYGSFSMSYRGVYSSALYSFHPWRWRWGAEAAQTNSSKLCTCSSGIWSLSRTSRI